MFKHNVAVGTPVYSKQFGKGTIVKNTNDPGDRMPILVEFPKLQSRKAFQKIVREEGPWGFSATNTEGNGPHADGTCLWFSLDGRISDSDPTIYFDFYSDFDFDEEN